MDIYQPIESYFSFIKQIQSIFHFFLFRDFTNFFTDVLLFSYKVHSTDIDSLNYKYLFWYQCNFTDSINRLNLIYLFKSKIPDKNNKNMDSDDDWGMEQASISASIPKIVLNAPNLSKMQASNIFPINTPSGKKSTVTNIANMFKGIGIVQSYLKQSQEDQDQSQSNIKKKIGTGFLMGKNKIMTSVSNLYFEEQKSMPTYVVFYPEQNDLSFSEQKKSVKSKNFAFNESYKFSKNQSNFTQNYGIIFVESSPQNLSGFEPFQFDWTYDEDEDAKNDLMIFGYRFNNETNNFEKSVKNFRPSKKSHGIIFGASSLKLNEGQEGSPLLIKQKNQMTGKIELKVVGLVTKNKQSTVAIEFGYLTQSKQVTKKQINSLGSQMLLSYKMTKDFRLISNENLKYKSEISESSKKVELESLMKEKDQQLRKYQNQIEKLSAQHQQQKIKSQKAENLNASTELRLIQALEKNQSLQKQIESMQKQEVNKMQMFHELNFLTQKNSKLSQSLDTATKTLVQKQKELVMFKNQIQKLREQGIQQQTSIQNLKRQTQRKNAQISNLMKHVQQLQQLLSTNNQQTSSLRKMISTLQTKVIQLHNINKDLVQKISQMQQIIQNLQEQVSKTKQDYEKVLFEVNQRKNDQHEQEVINMKREFDKLKNMYQSVNHESQNVIHQLKQKVQALQKQNQLLKQQKDEAEDQFSLQSPQQYVAKTFPPSRRQNDYRQNTQNQRNYVSNKYGIYMTQEGYVLNHSSIYIDMSNFLKYDWSTLERLNLTDCNILDYEWREFVQNAEKFSNLIIFKLAKNPITKINHEDFDNFMSLRIVYLDKQKFNQQQKKAFKEYGQNSICIVFEFQ